MGSETHNQEVTDSRIYWLRSGWVSVRSSGCGARHGGGEARFLFLAFKDRVISRPAHIMRSKRVVSEPETQVAGVRVSVGTLHIRDLKQKMKRNKKRNRKKMNIKRKQYLANSISDKFFLIS